MYLFKMLEHMLKQEEVVKPAPLTPNKTQKVESKKPGVYNKQQKGGPNKQPREMNSKLEDTAYCLFADTGQSFLALYNKEKINIILNGISHCENNKKSNMSKNFINKKIKKTKVYLSIIETRENGDIVADVYLDAEKTQSVNNFLIEEELAFSEKEEPEKISKEESLYVKPKEDNKEKQKDNKPKFSNNIIGYLTNHGAAPYQNQPGKSMSYFITIETQKGEETKWGIDFKRCIAESGVEIGDHIEIKKAGKDNESAKNFWSITHIEDRNDIVNKIGGPPVEENAPDFFPEEEPVYDMPLNWEYAPPSGWDDDGPPPDYDNIPIDWDEPTSVRKNKP